MSQEIVGYELGPFQVDIRKRELYKDGDLHEQQLSPKVFDLLVFLLERRAQVVSNSEIHCRFWSDSDGKEEKKARLTALWRELCDVLGDTDRQNRLYIKRDYGFRFVAMPP